MSTIRKLKEQVHQFIVLKVEGIILFIDRLYNVELCLTVCMCLCLCVAMHVFLLQKWTATITLCMFTTAAWCSCSEEISLRLTHSDPLSSTGNWSRWGVCVCALGCVLFECEHRFRVIFYSRWRAIIICVVKGEALHSNYPRLSITFFCSLQEIRYPAHTQTHTQA